MTHLDIVEVGPRDGLQNEPVALTPQTRIELIERLVAAGARRIEAVSFVNEERVPQMAGAQEVMNGVPRIGGVLYSGLVLNHRGFERALEAAVDEVTVVVIATETLSHRNQGVSVSQMLGVTADIVGSARQVEVPATVMVAASFGCPFEGEVGLDHLAGLVSRIADMGPQELAFADTIGVGLPHQVRAMVDIGNRVAPDLPLRFHFHNTRNTGYANAMAAMETGVTTLDASLGGYGGCPFAPGAAGNIGTEDLVYSAQRSGYSTDADLDATCDVASWLQSHIERPIQTMLPRAGSFPPSNQRDGAD